MIVDKPPWVSHKGAPIFSIDVDASGTRLCTCGQDNRTRIWNIQPLLIDSAENDDKVPKLLATLSQHVLAVNVARFSRSGQLLATGSDDKNICVYQLQSGKGRAAFGCQDAPDVENWQTIQLLRGHNNNVLDLAWAPDSTQLASASVDNLVIVWDVRQGKQMHMLRAHHGHVKGVAWDPYNVYLATQGEMDGIYVWRVGEWGQPVAHITDFVCGTPTTSFFSRLSWSPDGQFLVGVNGYGKPVHLAPLIVRNKWTCEYSLAGHKGAVSVARFCPRFLRRKSPEGHDELTSVAALGSADHKFTVWPLNAQQPLMTGKAFFRQGIMDIAWMPDGNTMFACSYDGTVAVVRYEEGELGPFASDAEVQELITQLYADNTKGKATGNISLDAHIKGLEMPDSAAPVAVPKPSQQALLAARMGQTVTVGAPAAAAGGVAPPSAATAAPVSAAGAAPSARGPGPKRLQPVPIDRTGITSGRAAPAAPALPAATPAAAAPPGAPAAATGGSVLDKRMLQQGPTEGQPPAKRIAPTRTAPAPVPAAAAQQPSGVPAAAAAPPAAAICATTGGATGGAGAAAGARGAAGAAGHAGGGGVQRPALPAADVAEVVQVEVLVPTWAGEDSVAVPSVRLQAVNGRQQDARRNRVSLLRCTGPDGVCWTDQLPGDVLLVCGSPAGFLAAATSMRELHIYSPAGRRLLPCVQLAGEPSFMCTEQKAQGEEGKGSSGKLLLLTSDGRMTLWDVLRRTQLLQADVLPLLHGHPDAVVSVVRLSNHGVPLVIMSNARAFVFDLDMRCWLRVTDAAQAGSVHRTLLPLATDTSELASIHAEASKQCDGGSGRFQAQLQASPEERLRQERVQIETNIASALVLRVPAEHDRWVATYVRKLAADADVLRLREMLAQAKQLAGTPEGRKQFDLLLKEVARCRGTNEGLDRLVQEYKDQVKPNALRQQVLRR